MANDTTCSGHYEGFASHRLHTDIDQGLHQPDILPHKITMLLLLEGLSTIKNQRHRKTPGNIAQELL